MNITLLTREGRKQIEAIEQAIQKDPIGFAIETMAEVSNTGRWCAAIKYIDGSWTILTFEEFNELGDHVEGGPHWSAIAEITVKLIRRAPFGENAA
jgi:hypothetical protein